MAAVTMLVCAGQGVATSYKGNYTQYTRQKEEQMAQQWAAWEKQQKEVSRLVSRRVLFIALWRSDKWENFCTTSCESVRNFEIPLS